MPASLTALLAATLLNTTLLPPELQLEVSAGLSSAIYQSVFSAATSTAVETTVQGRAAPGWLWAAGARLALTTTRPEGFARFSAAPTFGFWVPSAGLELGLTTRNELDPGSGVLAETRAATTQERSPAYVAIHSAPLSFRFFERWRVSVLELQVGTHLVDASRTMRMQLGLLSVGVMP